VLFRILLVKRIMYVEFKGDGLSGPGRICWVEMSKSRRAYRYAGKLLQKCAGYKYNCLDAETGEHYWVSGPKRDGTDRLYGGVVDIDDDARVEYWTSIRKKPECVELTSYRM
jgi:hypothetical protein